MLNFAVVPLVGTWIEMFIFISGGVVPSSFPSWERGLKYLVFFVYANPDFVVPLVGTWIEIFASSESSRVTNVVPLVGTWIEIFRAYGLGSRVHCRSPRGNVD